MLKMSSTGQSSACGPNGTPHPDVSRVKDVKASIVRGRLIREYLGSSRIPDVDKDDWFGTPKMRAIWRRNYEATGDHRRSPAEGARA